MERDKLVKLIPAASVLGTITTAASQSTGLPAGLPLVAAASDKACEVLGAGCLEPDLACLSYGTAATINTTCYRYIEPIPLIPPYPAAVPQAYSLEVLVTRGYWMISWFKEEFAHKEMQQAIERGVEPEALFDELVNAVPAGSEGLVLQPYWSPGLRLPGPEARGAVIGFHGGHTRAHLYRAILEGLGYALREGAMRTEKRTGVPIKSLRVAGGGSQSQAAMQLTADLFGLQTARPHVYEASGLGAAIDAAVGLGIHPDFPTAVKEMTRIGETFDPNPQVHSRYDALFHEVYLPLYARLKPLYEAMEKMPVDKTEN
jgi:sugar (pentulose or hexulose) kinase